MAAVAEILKTTFDSARAHLAGLEKTLHKLEKKAQTSLSGFSVRFDDVPKRLEGAWTGVAAKIKPVAEKIKPRLFVTREEFQALAAKVDELAAKIEKLSHAKNGRTRTVA